MVRVADEPRVRIGAGFWAAFRETVVREGIPYQWEALNDRLRDADPSGSIRNFRVAAGREKGEHQGYVFQDSDVYKWLEGVAFSLRWRPDPQLEKTADEAIEDVVSAQRPDGYLDTYYIINGLDKRWTNLKDNHELYCAGHMIEAACAYYRATGKRPLLDAAIRLVDHIDGVIGPGEGKIHGYPGHPVIEMALMRLYGVTREEKHLRLAEYFINQRGQAPLFFREEDERQVRKDHWTVESMANYRYYQADKPLREQEDAHGHAVRAMYLYSGMADVARETGDEGLKKACRRLWESATRRRMYITGALGAMDYGEGFSFDYDLPSDTVYGETCAAIGLVFFARRMLELEKKGEYADVMERALYNGVLSGMQLDGKRFFYVNPLEVVPEACRMDAIKRHVEPQRRRWFGCACCPPNLIRLLASLEDYVCSAREDALYIHLYAAGEIETEWNGRRVGVEIATEYPWKGEARLRVTAGEPCRGRVALRIPAWCKKWSASVNGEPVDAEPTDGYLSIDRTWENGDEIHLDMDMPAVFQKAHPRVRETAGQVAMTRGPLVYCLEEADNGKDLHALKRGEAAGAQIHWREELLGGVATITTPAVRENLDAWGEWPYGDALAEEAPATLTWIPYYAWANRGLGEMRVWIRE